MMKNTFRKYHRLIATLFCLPLLFTALTGISVAIADTWLHQEELAAFLITVHTFQIFKLDAVLPVLNGLGLIGLVATGISLTGLFAKRHQPKRIKERS
ncbi:peptidase [Nostoc sp. C052]|uniref:peptidase n=1 Tax=Nostoc sp. C052 TaxID=2576902 RepID=UPI00277B5AC9|nr:peptidase [Nostoc sp. C052]